MIALHDSATTGCRVTTFLSLSLSLFSRVSPASVLSVSSLFVLSLTFHLFLFSFFSFFSIEKSMFCGFLFSLFRSHFLTLSLSLFLYLTFPLHDKNEYKTIYKKITQEPGGLPTSAAIRAPLASSALSLEFTCYNRRV